MPPDLNKIEIKYFQSVIGTFLYYTRVLDFKMTPALNRIAAQQAQRTQFFLTKVQSLLYYVNVYSNTAFKILCK